MADSLDTFIADLKEPEALALADRYLKEGMDPLSVMAEARKGMQVVGERFSAGSYFIPDLIFSGEILKGVAGLVEPYLKKEGPAQKKGKIVFGTVAGDIHDIGKDIVSFMLDISGYEVHDLGIDVPPVRFVEKIKETGATVVGLSGFLTLAFDSMKDTIKAIEQAGLRGHVKIMVGGGQIDEHVRKYTGADGYGKDAMEAVKMADSWVGK